MRLARPGALGKFSLLRVLKAALPAALVVVAAVALVPGVPAEADDEKPAVPDPDARWRLFFTGDTRGYIHPCGCDTGLFGGLPRRATFLSKARRPGDILVDLGNLIEGTRPHERLKLRYVLEGLKRLEYDVLVPGQGELALGEDFERAVAEIERPATVCANLVRAAGGERVFDPWRLLRLPNDTTLAIVGLTSPYQKVPPAYAVLPPAEALGKALAQLRGKVDIVVVAAYLEGKVALDLAAAFPSVALVAAARVPQGSGALLSRGGAPVMLGGERGQYVAAVRFTESGAAVSGARAWLGDDVPDAAPFADLVRRHDEDAKQFGDAFAREAVAAFRAASWVGTAVCAECHKEEHASWHASKHAHAMAVLRERDQDSNPNCMKCHLQDLPDDNLTKLRNRGLGCESCHGGGGAHVVAMRKGLPRVPARTFPSRAAERCVDCHDEVNSPRFEPKLYWKKIAHGKTRRSLK